MGSIPRGVLRAMAGGGMNRPKDNWKPSETVDKSSGIRLYRFEKTVDVDGVSTVRKELIHVRMLHFNGPGKAPDDCPGLVNCERCRKAAMLTAQNTDDSMEQARKMEPQACPTFVVIPLDEPTRFRMYDAKFSAFQGIMLEIAKAGGYRSAKYPPPEAWAEGKSEVGDMFDKCVEDGVTKVCGPTGRDLILTPSKKNNGLYWSVSMMTDGNSVMPFPEDGKVLNPEIVTARIRAAMAKKAQGGKEGDS